MLPCRTHNALAPRINRAFREILLSNDCRNPEYYSPGALQPVPLRNQVTSQIEVPTHKPFACRIPDGRKMSYILSEMRLSHDAAVLNIFVCRFVYLKFLLHLQTAG